VRITCAVAAVVDSQIHCLPMLIIFRMNKSKAAVNDTAAATLSANKH